ncbi:MAG: hypothetical protein WA144_05435 [Candidatus Methanoperedens sp.]
MKKRYILLIGFLLVFIFIAGLFYYIVVDLNMVLWRESGQRDKYGYFVSVTGLSGREATGTTTVMVPIPATKDGKFVTTPSQKEPSYIQNLIYEYVLHTPEIYRKGPYWENTTETLNNKLIDGNWTTVIAETDKGYMLGFKTNKSTLTDIYFSVGVVMDSVDIFDPIYKNGPVLYPMRNLSNTSMIPYGNQVKYGSNPTYESYVYLSDNVEEGFTNFNIILQVSNDPTKWAKEYRGSYLNTVYANTSSSDKIAVRSTMEQSFGVHEQII